MCVHVLSEISIHSSALHNYPCSQTAANFLSTAFQPGDENTVYSTFVSQTISAKQATIDAAQQACNGYLPALGPTTDIPHHSMGPCTMNLDLLDQAATLGTRQIKFDGRKKSGTFCMSCRVPASTPPQGTHTYTQHRKGPVLGQIKL